jgi:hypothetical protein
MIIKMRLYLVAFFIFVIEQVNIIMNKNIFCIIACISFIHFACKKDQSKITNKTVAGEWVDTSFSRYAYTLMTHGNDSMDNTLLYDFGIIFQEDYKVKFKVLGIPLSWGTYEIINDSVIVYNTDANGEITTRLKVTNKSTKMNGGPWVYNYNNLHLEKQQ